MLISLAGAWLVQRALPLVQLAAAQGDTVIVRTVAEPRNWFDTVSGIASILISLSLLALCIGLIPAAWNFRNSYKKVNELLDKVYGDVNPLMRHASTIADNVNYITTSLRVDVQQVNQTIATANERLQEAVRLTERRVAEFNALLHVVQREAEDTFVSTAATLRGVREGAATFREDALGASSALRRTRLESAMLRAEDIAFDAERRDLAGELDAALAEEFDEIELESAQEDTLATDNEDALESGELSDGYIGGGPPVGGGGAERPRVRPRGERAPRRPRGGNA